MQTLRTKRAFKMKHFSSFLNGLHWKQIKATFLKGESPTFSIKESDFQGQKIQKIFRVTLKFAHP